MPKPEDVEARLARTVRVGLLLDVYGALLTERQREFIRLHHNEDMSFGEIAREFGISRQAVHDAVRQAEAAMENYEAGLELLAGGRRRAEAADSDGVHPPRAECEAIRDDLVAFRRRLAAQGIIYDAEEQARALDDIIARLERFLGE